MSELKLSRYTVSVPVGHRAEEHTAIYQTMTGGLVLLPEKSWRQLAGAPSRVDPSGVSPSVVDLLLKEGILLRSDIDERSLYQCWREQLLNDPGTVQSKVLVTRRCNNRCLYCVLGPSEAKDMSRDTALMMDRFYLGYIKEKRPQRVQDEFSGGEAFLNSRTIFETLGRRSSFCWGSGIEYSASIITNGTRIKRSHVEQLMEVGLKKIRVTLIGPARVHDALRPCSEEGKGYDTIMRNIESLTGIIPIGLEYQYDSGGEGHVWTLRELLDDIERRSIALEEISFTPIMATRDTDAFRSGAGDPAIYAMLAREVQERGLTGSREVPSNNCSADFGSRFVFDVDGSIIPCPVLKLGELAYGDIREGIDYLTLSQLRRKLPDKCMECEILPLCGGGCRYAGYIGSGSFTGVDCQFGMLSSALREYIRQEVGFSLGDGEVERAA